MNVEFSGKVWYWKGPAPFYFLTVPAKQCEVLKAASKLLTYGWGMIPVLANVGQTTWKTSLFPKDGQYIVPLKDLVRKAEDIGEGSKITVRLKLGA